MRIKATLMHFKDDKAVFSTDYGEITLPRKAVPAIYQEGSVGTLSFAQKEHEDEKHQKNARDFLGELLKDEEEN